MDQIFTVVVLLVIWSLYVGMGDKTVHFEGESQSPPEFEYLDNNDADSDIVLPTGGNLGMTTHGSWGDTVEGSKMAATITDTTDGVVTFKNSAELPEGSMSGDRPSSEPEPGSHEEPESAPHVEPSEETETRESANVNENDDDKDNNDDRVIDSEKGKTKDSSDKIGLLCRVAMKLVNAIETDIDFGGIGTTSGYVSLLRRNKIEAYFGSQLCIDIRKFLLDREEEPEQEEFLFSSNIKVFWSRHNQQEFDESLEIQRQLNL